MPINKHSSISPISSNFVFLLRNYNQLCDTYFYTSQFFSNLLSVIHLLYIYFSFFSSNIYLMLEQPLGSIDSERYSNLKACLKEVEIFAGTLIELSHLNFLLLLILSPVFSKATSLLSYSGSLSLSLSVLSILNSLSLQLLITLDA